MIKPKLCILKVVQKSGNTLAIPAALVRGLREMHLPDEDETEDFNSNAVDQAFDLPDGDIEITDLQTRTVTALATLHLTTRTCDYETLLENSVDEVLLEPNGEAHFKNGSDTFVYTPKKGWKIKGSKTKNRAALVQLLASLNGETLPEFLP